MQDAVSEKPLRRAGDFLPLHQDVVPSGGLRPQAKPLQGIDDGHSEPLHGQPLRVARVGDEGII